MNVILPTDSQENEENKPPLSPTHRGGKNKKKTVFGELSMSRCSSHHSPSREDETDTHHKGRRRKKYAAGDGGGCNHEPDKNDIMSPTTLHRNLEEQGMVGLFINADDNGDNSQSIDSGNSGSYSPSHKGLHRRKHIPPSLMEECSPERHSSPDRINLQISPGSSRSPTHSQNGGGSSSDCVRRKTGSFRRQKPYGIVKRRMICMIMALVLAFLGYFVVVGPTMKVSLLDALGSRTTTKRDWWMNLPRSFSASILLGGDGTRNFETVHEPAATTPRHPILSMKEEWKRVQSLTKRRRGRSRTRTKPPPLTNPPTMTVDGTSILSSLSSPRLTLNLPLHRELDSDEMVSHRNLKGDNANDGSSSGLRRRLNDTSNAPPICGGFARGAALLNPDHYPPSAHIGPKSRIVVTGALSQLGMELVLQLYEQCGVDFIVGIDSAQPNTRHDRIAMVESRYEYIQRRVPGFQRLMVPMFGLHPHPKLGDEAGLEDMDLSFDLVKRLTPTHIVHLAGMEEGRGEYSNYGDTDGASPFAEGGKSSMMRRFESLLSMDQVLSSVARCTTNRPQVVYISSNEAVDRSGVVYYSGVDGSSAAGPRPASVYGTSNLVKEVLASYYHRHHDVASVGLRVPTLFGPFSRPGSFINDLTERTIHSCIGGDADGLTKFHRDRDRYELPSLVARREGADLGSREELVFVYDVASAVVAAMQFQKDYNSPHIDPDGPTLLNIGSQTTASMKDIKELLEGHLGDLSDETWPRTNSSSLAHVIHNSGLSIHDNERNLNLIGWKHNTRLHEGTKTMLAWQTLKMYPFGIPPSLPSFAKFHDLIKDTLESLTYHALPCAAGCRWEGAAMCSPSPWDAVIDTTHKITQSCQYALYTVDLRTDLTSFDRQSAPSQRKGWEKTFCKIAFVSSSSKLAKATYAKELKSGAPMVEWNGSLKYGYWIIVTVPGSQYSMPEYERSLVKLNPTHFFHENIEKAMYINHARVVLTTDQAMGVMYHLDLPARKKREKTTIIDEHTKEPKDIWLPPHPQRHTVYFTNKYIHKSPDTSNVKNLARFVMKANGLAETKDIRAQVSFYEEAAHFTRTTMQRSPNYQDVYQENLFPFDYIRSTWLVHELKSEVGRNLRCEMYEEHSLWGNRDMEDLSMAFVLAKNKVKMRLGKMSDKTGSWGPEEWYPLLTPKEPNDENANTEGPVYLDYLETAQKVVTDSRGHELYISFLNQKSK